MRSRYHLPMHALPPLSVPPCVPAPDVLPLEFSFLVRPTGRLIMLGQVPCLDPFRTLPADTRLWLRWFEPDRADAEMVIASSVGDEGAPTERVVARASVPDRRGAWGLFRVAQAQGVVDLALAGPTTAGGPSPDVLHLFVYVDPSQPAAASALSVDPFPGRYQ